MAIFWFWMDVLIALIKAGLRLTNANACGKNNSSRMVEEVDWVEFE